MPKASKVKFTSNPFSSQIYTELTIGKIYCVIDIVKVSGYGQFRYEVQNDSGLIKDYPEDLFEITEYTFSYMEELSLAQQEIIIEISANRSNA